jgi:hypothetical protein
MGSWLLTSAVDSERLQRKLLFCWSYWRLALADVRLVKLAEVAEAARLER